MNDLLVHKINSHRPKAFKDKGMKDEVRLIFAKLCFECVIGNYQHWVKSVRGVPEVRATTEPSCS